MAWRLFGAKPLSKPMLGFSQLDPQEQTTNISEILVKIQNFSFTKMHLKLSSAKWWPFCPGGDEVMKPSLVLCAESLGYCVRSQYKITHKSYVYWSAHHFFNKWFSWVWTASSSWHHKMVQPLSLKFAWIISPHNLLSIWLRIHAGSKVNPC